MVFSREEPEEMIEAGELLALEDFHRAAEDTGTSQAAGTMVFKKLISQFGGDEPPFCFAEWLTANTPGHGVCTNFGFVGVKLPQFYIKTQVLYDCLEGIGPKQVRELYGTKGSQVMAVVLFDRVMPESL